VRLPHPQTPNAEMQGGVGDKRWRVPCKLEEKLQFTKGACNFLQGVGKNLQLQVTLLSSDYKEGEQA